MATRAAAFRGTARCTAVALATGGFLACDSPGSRETADAERVLAPEVVAEPHVPLPVESVLLISIDTLRADHLGVYGHPRPVSPNLDALAERSTVFRHVVASNPVTLPSHATLLTGTRPTRHGVHDNTTFKLQPEAETLAELLRAEGLRTGAIIGSLALDANFGLDQGFELYDDDIPGTGQDGEQRYFPERRAYQVSDLAIAFLRERQQEPFFLLIHYYDPHQGWHAPRALQRRFPNGYEAEVAYVDEQVGRVLAELETLGLDDSTLVIVTSDHGESLGAHGESTHAFFAYQVTQHVPLIVHVPGMTRRIDHLGVAGLVDVVPTILDVMGATLPTTLQGESLRAAWATPDRAAPGVPRLRYAESITPTTLDCNPITAVVGDRWKYLHGAVPELFDLANDPHEQNNLASAEPERVTAMRARLEAILSERSESGSAFFDVDESTRQGLEALGYLGDRADDSLTVNRERDDARDCIELFVHYGELVRARNNGRYAEARAMAKWLISKRPEMADIYRLLGDTATQKGKDKAAISHFRLYFALAEAQRGASESEAGERPVDHRMIGARLNLGIAYSRLGNYDESLEQFGLALGEAPELAAGHYYRGSVLLNLDQPEEALAEFRRALELDPDHALSAQQLEVLGFGSQCASAGRANGSEQCSTD